MIIVGCDFHPSFQQIAMLDTETGATEEHKLMHTSGEAESFYRNLASPAIVGIETVGNDQWFVQLLQRLGHEVCIGDAAQIRASYVRKQKTDRRDAKHILRLLVEERFPRIWIPDAEMRDHRQLLIHRHKLVQIRTRVKNELQHLMLNQGMQKKQKLWSTEGRAALASLPLEPWTDRRRNDLLNLWLCWMVNWKPSTMR
jgi:transposase